MFKARPPRQALLKRISRSASFAFPISAKLSWIMACLALSTSSLRKRWINDLIALIQSNSNSIMMKSSNEGRMHWLASKCKRGKLKRRLIKCKWSISTVVQASNASSSFSSIVLPIRSSSAQSPPTLFLNIRKPTRVVNCWLSNKTRTIASSWWSISKTPLKTRSPNTSFKCLLRPASHELTQIALARTQVNPRQNSSLSYSSSSSSTSKTLRRIETCQDSHRSRRKAMYCRPWLSIVTSSRTCRCATCSNKRLLLQWIEQVGSSRSQAPIRAPSSAIPMIETKRSLQTIRTFLVTRMEQKWAVSVPALATHCQTRRRSNRRTSSGAAPIELVQPMKRKIWIVW